MSFVYIFDLDQTLYPIGNSLFHQTSAYARAIITKVSGMEDETYYAMYQKYFAQRKQAKTYKTNYGYMCRVDKPIVQDEVKIIQSLM